MNRGPCPHCGKGGNKLHAADCKLVNDLHDTIDYCHAYHCAGDCGRPHNQADRIDYAKHALATFDALEREAARPIQEAKAAIRRKAKDAL